MKVLDPVVMTDAVLTSSSVDETDYPQWSSGTTYAEGARVLRGSAHKVYESVTGGNLANDPALTTPGKWIDAGATNRYAMFDEAIGSQTTAVGEIEAVFEPGAPVDAVAVLDTDAASVRVAVMDGATTAYDETQPGTGTAEDPASLLFLDLPAIEGAEITVTISAATGGDTVAVGTLMIGTLSDLGTTEAGATADITDFSKRETDDFGVTTIVKRSWQKRMVARSLIPTADVDAVQRLLAALRAKACLYIGEQGIEALVIYGFYKTFSIDLATETVSYCSITVEGLTEAGEVALLGTGLILAGSYDPDTVYQQRHVVQYEGSTWRYINPLPSSGNPPPTLPVEENEFWQVLARAGADGSSAVVAFLTNETHTLPADSSGNVTSYSGAGGDFVIFAGEVDISSAFSLATQSNPQGLTVGYSGQTYSVTGGLDVGEGGATVTIRATGSGDYAGIIVDKVFTVAKSSAGADGAPAKTLTIISDRQTIAYDAAGAATPSTQTTTFAANKQNTSATVTWTVTDAAGNARTPTTSYLSAATGDSVTMSESQFASARDSTSGVIVTGTLTDGVTIVDRISVVRVKEGSTGSTGAAAVVGFLTNEAHTLPAANDGTVSSYSGATGEFKVYAGLTDVSSSFTLATQSNPQSLTIGYSSQTYTVSGGFDAGEDIASATVRATGSGSYSGVTIDKVFTLGKSKTGGAGVNAKTLTVLSDRQTIAYDAAGSPSPSTQTTTFSVNKQNTTATVTWSIQDAEGNARTPTSSFLSASTGDSVTMSESEFAGARNGTSGVIITATATDGVTMTDKISVVRVKEGSTGATGAAAVIGFLTNEAHTLPAANDGTVSSYAGATGDFKVFAGTGDVSSSFSLSTQSNPQSLTIGYSSQTFTVSGGFDAGEDNAYVTIRATGSGAYSGVTIDKILSLAKSKTGGVGSTGAAAKTLTVLSDRQTIAYDAAGSPSPSTQTTTFSTNKQNTSATVTWSVQDADGNARTPTTSYLSAATGDSVTMTESQFASARNGTSGVIITGSLSDGVTITDKISIVRVKEGTAGAAGDDGTSPYDLDLSISNFVILADHTGTTKAGQVPKTSSVTLKEGTTDVLGSASVTATPSSGISCSYSGGTVTITAANSPGYIDVEATIGGTPVGEKRIEITRELSQPPPAPASQSIDVNFSSTSSSFAQHTQSVFMKADGSGNIKVQLSGIYYATGPSPQGGADVECNLSYRAAGSGTWSQDGPVSGSGAFYVFSLGYNFPGTINSGSVTLSGLTPNANYEFSIQYRVSSLADSATGASSSNLILTVSQ